MTIEFSGVQDVVLHQDGSFDISVFGITNPETVASDRDIRLAIWAVEDPEDFESFLIWYYELASIDLPDADVLDAGETLSVLTFSGTYAAPFFDGLYSIAVVLLDDVGQGDPVILDYQLDDDTLLIGPPPPVSGLQKGTGDDDELTGLATRDTIYGFGGDDGLDGGLDDDWLDGAAGKDLLFGNGQSDWLFGGDGKDTLLGQAGRDTLDGGFGNDVLRGGKGADTLTGSFGDDVFQFKRADIDGTVDRIADFEYGDRIDLSHLDLDWIGTGAFSGTASELRYVADTETYSGGWLRADLDGDGASDLTIRVNGFFTDLAKDDFIL